jgi:hypothetical protein
MPKFLIYLSIYFCLRSYGLSFRPSSEGVVQFRQWFNSAVYGVSARARPLKTDKKKALTSKAEVNR